MDPSPPDMFCTLTTTSGRLAEGLSCQSAWRHEPFTENRLLACSVPYLTSEADEHAELLAAQLVRDVADDLVELADSTSDTAFLPPSP